MPIIVSHAAVAGNRTSRIHEDGKAVALTHFLAPPAGDTARPQAMLVEEAPGRHLRTHYHEQDEFQLFVAGGGTNGRHPIQPVQVHFARKHTPYGPIIASEAGCDFLTLRARRDGGAKFLPESRTLLEAVPGRRPWQASAVVPDLADAPASTLVPLDGLQDGRGLGASALRLAAGDALRIPASAGSAGQYVVVLRGSLVHAQLEHAGLALVWLDANEDGFDLRAGASGLEALVLRFPLPQVEAPAPAPAPELKVWECVLCGFLYDEAQGLPEDGIAPGTRWTDVPDTFGCPDCAAVKADFVMVEV